MDSVKVTLGRVCCKSRGGPSWPKVVGRWFQCVLQATVGRPDHTGAQWSRPRPQLGHGTQLRLVTIVRTLVMGSVVILIGYIHVSTTTAALGHLSQASAAHDQTDRPPREAATDGICDQPRPQYAFGADQSTHQLISIAQVHAMPVGCFHRLQRQPPQHEPPRPASCARSSPVAAARYITRGGFIAASTSAGSVDSRRSPWSFDGLKLRAGGGLRAP